MLTFRKTKKKFFFLFLESPAKKPRNLRRSTFEMLKKREKCKGNIFLTKK